MGIILDTVDDMFSRNTALTVIAVVFVLALCACGGGDDTSAGSNESTSTTADQSTGDDHGDDEDGHGDDEDGHGDDEDGHDDEDDHGDDHDDEDGDDHDDHDDHDDEAGTGLGAHEHGSAELLVAWNGGDMVIDLISPTHNIFGFEYEASTDEDLAIVADRTAALSDPDVMVLNAEAGCSLSGDVVTELEYEGSHAELTASWLYVCDNPSSIMELDATELFARFPAFQDVDAQWASELGQSSAELTPSATTLDLGQ